MRIDKDWIIEKAKAEDGQEIGAGLLARDPDFRRAMICPFCGNKEITECIGRVYCGPHKLSDGSYHPAVPMVEDVTR